MGQEAQDDLVAAAVDQLGALPMAAHLMRGLAFGLAYRRQEVELDLHGTDPSGVLKFTISGPELFARLSF